MWLEAVLNILRVTSNILRPSLNVFNCLIVLLTLMLQLVITLGLCLIVLKDKSEGQATTTVLEILGFYWSEQGPRALASGLKLNEAPAEVGLSVEDVIYFLLSPMLFSIFFRRES